MTDIVQKRLSNNFKRSMHYLTLVFNDFFILALIFLFGALMFWYAQNIRNWPNNLWFYKPLLALIWTVVLGIGNFATFFQSADRQFLFNQDKNLDQYFRPLYTHSLILPTILIVLVTGLLFPFATMRSDLSIVGLVVIGLSLILNKLNQFRLIKRSFYFNDHDYYNYWLYLAINFVVLLISLYTSFWVYLVVVLVAAFIISRLPRGKLFDWYRAIDSEERRQDLVNSFYSMFTDVPEKKVKISRRKYLDFLINNKNQDANTFLYQRALLRDPEYSNLLIRMTIFSVLLSWCLQDWRWATAFGALVIFLTLYQLLPLGTVYEHNMMYHVMPIPMKKRGRALGRVLQKGMLVEWALISVALVIFSPEKIYALLGVIGLLAFTFILLYTYLPVRIENLFKKIRY